MSNPIRHWRLRPTLNVLFCLAVCGHSQAIESNPNIIVMMADDMGMGDTSAYQDFTGNADDVQVHTPNMERLARLGVRFTDAHTPSSRCSPTRYALLTGRYSWRNRLKHWVLFGAQGDPMIEADRPTIATMLRDAGYHTAIVGKWHVGLRYRRSDGRPAAGWDDADLTQPMHTTPIDHGFDFVRITSRSHGTSGPDAEQPSNPKNRGANTRGPGHIHGRLAIGATTPGRQLVKDGPNSYRLTKLGSRHSDSAIEFLNDHVMNAATQKSPFFLYYPANSNHGPYTPDVAIDGQPVAGAARTKSGQPMDARHDFIYENDVALGRLLDWLQHEADPRTPTRKLIENTLVIFTSDNGAEKNSNIATGPFRSNKGSVYEGGHRVPFLVTWPAGGVGDGDSTTVGRTTDALMGLQDLYATFAELVESELPDLLDGEKGAEDSFSVLAAFRGDRQTGRPPMLFNDHKEAKSDPAVTAIRLDLSAEDGAEFNGKWKLFLDAKLLRFGEADPYELYNLANDPWEKHNLIEQSGRKPLVDLLTKKAQLHRNAGGHRLANLARTERIVFDWRPITDSKSLAPQFDGQPTSGVTAHSNGLAMSVSGADVRGNATFTCSPAGLGISHGNSGQVDTGEAIVFRFNHDVIVESAAIVSGDGVCGGSYQVGENSPLAIYCVDADNDAKDQSGILSDIGLLRAGTTLRFDSSSHLGVEAEGAWRLQKLTVREVSVDDIRH